LPTATATATPLARIELRAGTVQQDGTVCIEAMVFGDSARIIGARADIAFDTRVLRLADASRCSLNPALADGGPECSEPHRDGPPCKALARSLTDCSATPGEVICSGLPRPFDVFRGIVTGREAPGDAMIPEGTIVYRCAFEVYDRSLLPARLQQRATAIYDGSGARLAVGAPDGYVVHEGAPNSGCAWAALPPATASPLPSATATWTLPPPTSHPTSTRVSSPTRSPTGEPTGTPTAGMSVTPTGSPRTAATATATVVDEAEDGDGCGIAASGGSGGGMLLGLGALVLLWSRRVAAVT